MKKILLTAAACIAGFFCLHAQSPNHDSIHIHVIKNQNGNILEIDTAVAAGQAENLAQWMSAQGIEMAPMPGQADSMQMMFVEVQELMSDSADVEMLMRIPMPPPCPPLPPLPPGEAPEAPEMMMIINEAPPAPGAEPVKIVRVVKALPPGEPGNENRQVIVLCDSTQKNTTVKRMVVVTEDISPARVPAPPAPPATAEKKTTLATELMTVYPNPTDGNITLSFEIPGTGKTYITITDVNGKLVYEEQLGEAFSGRYKKEINIGTAKGSYFIEVKKAGTVLVKTVLVQ